MKIVFLPGDTYDIRGVVKLPNGNWVSKYALICVFNELYYGTDQRDKRMKKLVPAGIAGSSRTALLSLNFTGLSR